MLVHAVEAEDFLSFGKRERLEVDRSLLVVTGPNGVGKTNLGACLDLASAAVGRAAGEPDTDHLAKYASAGHDGAASFEVALDLELDQDRERQQVRAFVCAAYVSSPTGAPDRLSAHDHDEEIRRRLIPDSLTIIWTGRLVVRYDATLPQPWFAAWEFGHGGKTWHIVLLGASRDRLFHGSADHLASPVGGGNTRDFLLGGKDADGTGIDFCAALVALGAPAVLGVQGLMAGPGPIPLSWRELAPNRELSEYGNRSFSFGSVLSAAMQRCLASAFRADKGGSIVVCMRKCP
jgi:hypothetical protein